MKVREIKERQISIEIYIKMKERKNNRNEKYSCNI